MDPFVPGPAAERRFIERYLQNIHRIPFPDLQSERHLLEAYCGSPDPALMGRVLLPNLRFCAGQALLLCDGEVPALELIQEATLGFILMMRTYDPSYAGLLFSYLRFRLRDNLIKYIAETMGRPLGPEDPGLLCHLRSLGLRPAPTKTVVPGPDPSVLLQQHGICPALWRSCEDRVLLRDVPLSEVAGVVMERRLHEIAGTEATDPETQLAGPSFARRAVQTIKQVLPFFPPGEAALLRAFYLSDQPQGMKEIAQAQGVTRSRVGQKIQAARLRLRRVLLELPPWQDAANDAPNNAANDAAPGWAQGEELDGPFDSLRAPHFRRLVLDFCWRKLRKSNMDVKTCKKMMTALTVLIDQRLGRSDPRHEAARSWLGRALALSNGDSYKAGLQEGFVRGVERGRELERQAICQPERQVPAWEQAQRTPTRQELRTLQNLAMKLCTMRFGWNEEVNKRIGSVQRPELLDHLFIMLGSTATAEEALQRAGIAATSSARAAR